jgi:hypothetical protein
MIRFWRVFEESEGKPLTLFHGVGGSRELPIGSWVEAEERPVIDGSGGTEYRSGFHVFGGPEQAEQLLTRFTKPRPLVVAAVQVKGSLRAKHHSPQDVYLAQKMLVTEDNWNNRYQPETAP